MPTKVAPLAAFQSSERPLPQPRSITCVARRKLQKLPQLTLTDPDPSSGVDTRLVTRVRMQRLVEIFRLLRERLLRAQIEILARVLRIVCAAAGARQRPAVRAGRLAVELRRSVRLPRRVSRDEPSVAARAAHGGEELIGNQKSPGCS